MMCALFQMMKCLSNCCRNQNLQAGHAIIDSIKAALCEWRRAQRNGESLSISLEDIGRLVLGACEVSSHGALLHLDYEFLGQLWDFVSKSGRAPLNDPVSEKDSNDYLWEAVDLISLAEQVRFCVQMEEQYEIDIWQRIAASLLLIDEWLINVADSMIQMNNTVTFEMLTRVPLSCVHAALAGNSSASISLRQSIVRISCQSACCFVECVQGKEAGNLMGSLGAPQSLNKFVVIVVKMLTACGEVLVAAHSVSKQQGLFTVVVMICSL